MAKRKSPPSPAKAGLKGFHRQDCRRHAAHHLPLYQDKAVTPTSLEDIFTPIWSGTVFPGLFLGVLANDIVIWFWIGSHDNYERPIRELR